MKKDLKSFVISLSVVLLIAYGVIMSVIGIRSFIKSQNLKQQISSLTLLHREMERKFEAISFHLEDYEKEKTALGQSLERLGRDSKKKLDEASLDAQEYKKKISQMTQRLDSAQKQLLALKEENKLLKVSPRDTKRQNELKQVLADKQGEISKFKQKIISLQQELRDKKATLHYNLAVNFSQRENFEDAIIEYEKALNIDSGHFSSHYNLGILYEEYKKDFSKAIFHYRQYLQLCPDAPEASQVKQWIQVIQAKQVGAPGQ